MKQSEGASFAAPAAEVSDTVKLSLRRTVTLMHPEWLHGLCVCTWCTLTAKHPNCVWYSSYTVRLTRNLNASIESLDPYSRVEGRTLDDLSSRTKYGWRLQLAPQCRTWRTDLKLKSMTYTNSTPSILACMHMDVRICMLYVHRVGTIEMFWLTLKLSLELCLNWNSWKSSSIYCTAIGTLNNNRSKIEWQIEQQLCVVNDISSYRDPLNPSTLA